MVVHMITGVDRPEALDDVKKTKLLLLGYKNFGRGEKYREAFPDAVQANLNQWYRELPLIAMRHHVSFDTLAISLLKPGRLFKEESVYKSRYMGDEGQFSMYVDGVTQQYAISSYSKERHAWSDIYAMFQTVRESAGHAIAGPAIRR